MIAASPDWSLSHCIRTMLLSASETAQSQIDFDRSVEALADGTVQMAIAKLCRPSSFTRPLPILLASLFVLVLSEVETEGQDNVASVSDLAVPDNPPPIGTQVQDLQFTDIRAMNRSLADLGQQDACVFIFTTTDCPLVRRYMPRINELHAQFHSSKVTFVLVNVGGGDSLRDMASQAIEFESPCIFVRDFDQMTVKALGVRRTPEAVVLDREHRIRYRGRIDDQHRVAGSRPQPTRHDLQLAIEEVLANQPVSVPETLTDGCLITERPKLTADASVTWSSCIANIIYKHCANCHAEEQAAPFPLTSYESVVEHAAMIAEVVRNETMPPWYATKGHGEFQNDASLSPTEHRQLLTWLSNGLPAGNLAEAPKSPKPNTSPWRIGEPDLVITMLEEHTIPATGIIPYRYTVLPYLFLNETWVEAFEIRPENKAVVHHCNMAYVTSDGAGEETFITGYVPGGQPMDLGRFQNNVAFRIPAGAGLGLQIHYTTTGKEETSRIQVGIRFPKQAVREQVRHFLLDPRRWTIPPFDPAYKVSAVHELDRDATILGLFTHMHVRGRDMTYTALTPGQKPEILLQIPNFNFEWQLGYEIAAGKKQLPKGTRIQAVAHFDNSPFNPFNPDPAVPVKYGLQTADEMFNGFVFYTDTNEQLDVVVDPKTGRVE